MSQSMRCALLECRNMKDKQWHLLCPAHWSKVSPDTQRKLYDVYKAAPDSDEHWDLMAQAKHEARGGYKLTCEVCGAGMPEGATLMRVNKPGEVPARWRCREHMSHEQQAEVDPDVSAIVEAIAPQEKGTTNG